MFKEAVDEFNSLRGATSAQVEKACVDEVFVDAVFFEKDKGESAVQAHEYALEEEVEVDVLAEVALFATEL